MTHGHSAHGRSPTYYTWAGMRQRCNNPKHKAYKYYGAKGIRICDRWEKFEHFLKDMGERPANKTLDRIDPYGNYEPYNCRWATDEEQGLARRNSTIFQYLSVVSELTPRGVGKDLPQGGNR